MGAADTKLVKKVKLSKSDALTFIGKYDTVRKREITVENVSDKVIAFKVTAFKLKITPLNLVRLLPGSDSGYVKPKEKATIAVIAKKYTGPNPPPPERVVILLAVAPEGRPDNPAEFWSDATKSKAFRQKYPVVFLEEANVETVKEAKVETGKEAKDCEKDKKEEKAEESGGQDSGAFGGSD